MLRYINEPANTRIAIAFREFIKATQEIYVPSADASARPEFLRLGLSDSAVLEINKADIVLLSADLDLCLASEAAGYIAFNFNHIRAQRFESVSPFTEAAEKRFLSSPWLPCLRGETEGFTPSASPGRARATSAGGAGACR